MLVPWGDRPPERRGDAPWPGSLPALAPASVFRDRPSVVLLDDTGGTVSIDGRGTVSAGPSSFAVEGGEPARVRAWAGPWPVVERWWDPDRARRVHRFQVVDDVGCAWLLVRDDLGWWAEARYD
ncbi:hypothetical protein ACDF64_13380 [Agromyces sp. MMS24-JH15]|uniref:hypothetical protein n=1 Tax=Agromyces sp. MMS24-JH15 TaxID=3243765 RepID=UPI0037499442